MHACFAHRVLRMREGDPLEVCDGAGAIATGQLRGITVHNKAYVETTADIMQVHTLFCAGIEEPRRSTREREAAVDTLHEMYMSASQYLPDTK